MLYPSSIQYGFNTSTSFNSSSLYLYIYILVLSCFFDKKFFLLYVIRNIGKIYEFDETIYCYVDNEKIKEKYREYFVYNLELSGFDTRNISEDVKRRCGLNKPICYIFRNFNGFS